MGYVVFLSTVVLLSFVNLCRFCGVPSTKEWLGMCFSFLYTQKHQSESVCTTKSFDSYFVREMTRLKPQCVITRTKKNEPNDSVLHNDSLSHFDVFCVPINVMETFIKLLAIL